MRQLESGEAPLDDSIKLYEEGDQLKQQCEARLDAAQARIEQIQFGRDGAPGGTAPFGERMTARGRARRSRRRDRPRLRCPAAVPRDGRARLYEAMRYAAIGGGKRLRPLLVARRLRSVPRRSRSGRCGSRSRSSASTSIR